MLRCSLGANQSAGSISRDHLKANRNIQIVSRDLQTAVLNRVVCKQSLSITVSDLWMRAEDDLHMYFESSCYKQIFRITYMF